MKNFSIVLLLLIVIGGGVYIYANRTPAFTPSVLVISPKGGEDFKLGERFRYVVEVDHQKPGTLKVWLTTTNATTTWQNSSHFDFGTINSDEFDVDSMARGSFVLGSDAQNKRIPVGDTYYLLGVWESADKNEQVQAFSSYQFKISK